MNFWRHFLTHFMLTLTDLRKKMCNIVMRLFLQTFNHCKGGKGLYTQHPDDDLLLAKVGCQSDKSPDDALFFLKNSLHQSVRSTLNESPQINNRIALHFQVAT